MANEVSVSVIIIETGDGSYRATCPDLELEAKGVSSEEALDNLKASIAGLVREKGLGNVQMNAVKCMKIKVAI